ncbi:hypothetical protein ACQR1I_09210 [Bradyrhizobium sp. HKCCYLS2038]|uniref:hypothetical protein n=1 Tax=unclassified Bradyrhizobium TaxID=2631580 RepID=UPI003EB9CC44
MGMKTIDGAPITMDAIFAFGAKVETVYSVYCVHKPECTTPDLEFGSTDRWFKSGFSEAP